MNNPIISINISSIDIGQLNKAIESCSNKIQYLIMNEDTLDSLRATAFCKNRLCCHANSMNTYHGIPIVIASWFSFGDIDLVQGDKKI